MLTQERVQAIWDAALKKAKPFLIDGTLTPDKSYKRPEMWAGYNRACDDRERSLPHIEPGAFAEQLFRYRAPNQTEQEFDYVKNNYKQVTLPVFMGMESNVNRAMSPTNWTLEFTSSDLETYATTGVREWGSVENFIQYALIRPKIADPMGVITVAPMELDVVETEAGIFVDQSIKVRPDLMYTAVNDVWDFAFDDFYLLRLPYNSDLTFGRATKNIGVVCWLIDDTNIWRIEQTGRPADWTFDISLEYAHNIGQAPCIHMMGVPSVAMGRLQWQSPFAPAVDLLDIVLSNTQYVQVSVVKSMYPVPVMVGDQCEYVDSAHNAACLGGTLTWYDGTDPIQMPCPSCKGTGRKSRLGPFGELVIIPPSSLEGQGSNGINASNALAYVGAPTDPSRFVESWTDRFTDQARKLIHLDANDTAAVQAKTATEAGIAKKSAEAFVKPIVGQVFKIFDFILEMMAAYRGEKDAYMLQPPTHFDIRTPEEMLLELTDAVTNGLPPSVIDYLTWQYTVQKFKGDDEALAAFEAISQADRLLTLPWAVMTSEAAAGRLKSWEIAMHYGGLYLYEQLAGEDQGFLEKSASEKAKLLQDRAKLESEAPADQSSPLAKLSALIKAPATLPPAPAAPSAPKTQAPTPAMPIPVISHTRSAPGTA